jgi:hypothetical protein
LRPARRWAIKTRPGFGGFMTRFAWAAIAALLPVTALAEDAKLAQAELAAMSRLPICKSEAGEPSELSIKGC